VKKMKTKFVFENDLKAKREKIIEKRNKAEMKAMSAKNAFQDAENRAYRLQKKADDLQNKLAGINELISRCKDGKLEVG